MLKPYYIRINTSEAYKTKPKEYIANTIICKDDSALLYEFE